MQWRWSIAESAREVVLWGTRASLHLLISSYTHPVQLARPQTRQLLPTSFAPSGEMGKLGVFRPPRIEFTQSIRPPVPSCLRVNLLRYQLWVPGQDAANQMPWTYVIEEGPPETGREWCRIAWCSCI